MRVLAVATALFLSSSMVPSYAQQHGNAPTQNQSQATPAQEQPQTTSVQPSARQLAQIEESLQRVEDIDIRHDWRALLIWAE